MIEVAKILYDAYRASANALPHKGGVPEWDVLPAEERVHWFRVGDLAVHLAAQAVVAASEGTETP